MINVRGLYKNFPNQTFGNSIEVFNNVNLDLEKGKIVLLTGDSGSGKTTFLKILATIENFNLGEIEIDGYKYSNMTGEDKSLLLRNKFSIIFQNYNLINSINIFENLKIPLLLQNNSVKSTKYKIDEILSRIGMNQSRNTYPENLSGGQQQRIAIARAIITDKDYIFADEPTSSLDESNTSNILDLFQELKHKGKTLIISSHDKAYKDFADLCLKIENKNIISL